mgnify:CR=1 FL=1|jgi:hypothetical protein
MPALNIKLDRDSYCKILGKNLAHRRFICNEIVLWANNLVSNRIIS